MIDAFVCIGIISVVAVGFLIVIKVLDWFADRKTF
jgi:hypothetical protein